MSNYFIHQKMKCLYQEKNSSGCVWALKNCFEKVKSTEGIYEMEGIPMLPNNHKEEVNTSKYQIIIQDYGCLTKDNLEEFFSAGIKLLILGAKDWELEFAEQALDMVAEYKDIIYLFNFMNARQFQQVMKSMNRKNSYRVPYEPDPFARITDKNGLELFHELIRFSRKKTGVFTKLEAILQVNNRIRRKEKYET
jgi:serine/threonine-protein kinase